MDESEELTESLLKGFMVLKRELKTGEGFDPEFWNLLGPISRTKLEEGSSMHQFKIPEPALEKASEVLEHLMQDERWQDARDLAQLLVILDSDNAELWLMLGNSRYRLGTYQEALMAYAMAAMSDPYDLRSRIWAALTLTKLNQKEEAKELLASSIETLNELPDEPYLFKDELLEFYDNQFSC